MFICLIHAITAAINIFQGKLVTDAFQDASIR